MEKVKVVADGSRSLMTGGLPPLPATPSTFSTTRTVPPRPVAPSPSASVPPVPVGPTTSPTDLTSVLDELVGTVEGVRSAILASVDGFGLARSNSMSDEASHPAMLAAAIGLARQLVVMGGGSQLRQLVVDHDGGLMLVWPMGDQRVLAVLATNSVEQRRVRSFVQTRVTWFAGSTS
ncbi:MAG TPA: roadblock/LC7 domain-containing protein [Ilumatobacteraceae bacterium]|nr:roadblock/LC7 domain-containing protein [Ilumatobacteraceae bacterium]